MSYGPRRTTFVPTSSTAASISATGAQHNNSVLATRIAEKRQELESLTQLRDLSANFAGQMEQLQDRLSNLVDGTEAVALVVSNWDSVLRAIALAADYFSNPDEKSTGDVESNDKESLNKSQLPETLVRIKTFSDEESVNQES
ncbi:DASH complex subunit Dad2-domain-containing protein [Lipomyces japonicus]|uniref:DASH complex subunit Dad2-domain-containing protein n=1 Tax=Lipomyces japonicus TaxID=56871 RepID=UPI0034CF1FCB